MTKSNEEIMHQQESFDNIYRHPTAGRLQKKSEKPTVKADLDDGFARIANTLLQALAKSKLSGRSHQIVYAVFLETYAWQGRKTHSITNADLSSRTGISRSKISEIKAELFSKKILLSNNGEIGINTAISEWQKQEKIAIPENGYDTRKRVNPYPKTGKSIPENGVTIKEKKEKREELVPNGTCQTASSSDDNDLESFTPKKRDQIPYGKIVDLYHKILPELPGVIKLTPARKAQIKARCCPDELPALEDWRKYFEMVRKSKFLMGKATPFGDRKPFIANLEWLTKQANIVKVYEGKYS